MVFSLYIVYQLLIGFSSATNAEADPTNSGKIVTAQTITVISWYTYPVVDLLTTLGINVSGYYEVVVTEDLDLRWKCWCSAYMLLLEPLSLHAC